MLNETIEGSVRTEDSVQKTNRSLSFERKREVDKATVPENGILDWSTPAEPAVMKTDSRSKATAEA